MREEEEEEAGADDGDGDGAVSSYESQGSFSLLLRTTLTLLDRLHRKGKREIAMAEETTEP